jgi:hypothetical protein
MFFSQLLAQVLLSLTYLSGVCVSITVKFNRLWAHTHTVLRPSEKMSRHKTGGVSKLLERAEDYCLWANEIAVYLSSKGVGLIPSGKEVLDPKAWPVEKREFLRQQDMACSIISRSTLSMGSDLSNPVQLLVKLQMEYTPSTSAYLK